MKTLHAVVAATMPKHLTLATARALLSIKPNLKMLITPALLGALLLSPVLGRAQVSSSLQAYCDDLGREAIILAQARDCGASQEDLLNNARGQLSQSARGDILKLTSADIMDVLNFAYDNPQLDPVSVGYDVQNTCYERFQTAEQ